MNNLSQDWPVFAMLGLFVSFVIYVIIKGNQAEKEKKEARPQDKVNK
ncbi:MAG: hypothetical protein PHC29_01695 [Candidatus Omnitrophica bacterium]|nr:hypothetical protein [Candidatus Omnitrophota bacterium]